jgi:hypothetical protein
MKTQMIYRANQLTNLKLNASYLEELKNCKVLLFNEHSVKATISYEDDRVKIEMYNV